MDKKLVALLCLILTGCGTAFVNVHTKYDEFEGFTKHRMVNNTLAGGSDLFNDFSLNIQSAKTKEGKIYYFLIVDYMGTGWLFIESDESLVLLIDGQRYGFKGDGSGKHREVMSGDFVSETAFYPNVTIGDLRRIANAKEVKVKIKGSTSYVERRFSKRNFSIFKDFLAKYAFSENQ